MLRPVIATDGDEAEHAARTINALVDALERIEHPGCRYALKDGTPEPGCRCGACIAHEALVYFRGQ